MRESAYARALGRRAFFVLSASVVALGLTPAPALGATPTKLAITTAAKSIAAGACSTAITIQTQNASSVATAVATATTVTVSGTSYQFFSDSACSVKVGTLTIPAGASSTKLFIKSKVAGTRYVFASTPNQGYVSQNETVTPGAAKALAFATQPTSSTAGTALSSVQVSVNDAYGNRVSTSGTTVTVALGANPGAATLSGTKSVATSAGLAKFAGLSLNKAGTGYTLLASSTGLTSATSAAFSITGTAPAPSPSPSTSPSTSPSPKPSATPSPSPTATTTPVGMRPLPSWLTGVTIDAISPLNDIITALKNMAVKPITRIVFDEFVPASDYKSAVTQIAPVSYVMGELLDSYYVKQYTASQYSARVKEYLDSMDGMVDLWEVGNETNGEWLGNTSDVVAKVSDAYDQVKARGKRAALTLYYNKDCWADPAHEMFAWTQNNIPARMKSGVDYVLVSYYEDDCNGLKPDWQAVFSKLATIFPNAKLGIGEMGTTVASKKADFINRYYNMQLSVPNFVGGNFYWYFRQDMVPYSQPLWNTLNTAIQ